jgi:hypothetical protein
VEAIYHQHFWIHKHCPWLFGFLTLSVGLILSKKVFWPEAVAKEARKDESIHQQ